MRVTTRSILPSSRLKRSTRIISGTIGMNRLKLPGVPVGFSQRRECHEVRPHVGQLAVQRRVKASTHRRMIARRSNPPAATNGWPSAAMPAINSIFRCFGIWGSLVQDSDDELPIV